MIQNDVGFPGCPCKTRWQFGDQNDTFCFTHIPKCGGSALSVILRSFLQRCKKQNMCRTPSNFRENRSIIHMKSQPLIAVGSVCQLGYTCFQQILNDWFSAGLCHTMQGYVGHHLACDGFLRQDQALDFPESIKRGSQASAEGQFWPIAIFREPVARVFSAYKHNLREISKVIYQAFFSACGTIRFSSPLPLLSLIVWEYYCSISLLL